MPMAVDTCLSTTKITKGTKREIEWRVFLDWKMSHWGEHVIEACVVPEIGFN